MKRIVLRHGGVRAICRSTLREGSRRRTHVTARGQRSRRVQCRRVQRVVQEVVVPKVFVAAEQQPKVVPFVLFDAQARHVIGIAAISKVAERQGVEQRCFVVERAHLEVEIEEPEPGTQVLERVVGG